MKIFNKASEDSDRRWDGKNRARALAFEDWEFRAKVDIAWHRERNGTNPKTGSVWFLVTLREIDQGRYLARWTPQLDEPLLFSSSLPRTFSNGLNRWSNSFDCNLNLHFFEIFPNRVQLRSFWNESELIDAFRSEFTRFTR